MKAVFDPRSASYFVLQPGLPLLLSGESHWPSRAELKEALELHGYVLHKDMTVTTAEQAKEVA